MFDLRFPNCDPYWALPPQVNSHAALYNSAIGLFSAARRTGLIERAKCILLRRAWRLHSLSALCPGQVRERHYIGIRCVNVSQICGSMGRTCDFDHLLHPLDERLRDRWVSVAVARRQGITLPAVSLVQVGECYFVEDGHHRLSVARALGESAVDAEVTVWEVAGQLPWPQRARRGVPRLSLRPA